MPYAVWSSFIISRTTSQKDQWIYFQTSDSQRRSAAPGRGRDRIAMRASWRPLAPLRLLLGLATLLCVGQLRREADAQSTRRLLKPDMNSGPRRAQSADAADGHAASAGGGGSSLEPSGFPGTAVQRRSIALEQIANLTQAQLDGDWGDIRRSLLQSCGLADSSRTAVGRGRTTHCFADYNHVDCCTMQAGVSHNENEGRVAGMHRSNQLGPGITASSLESHGSGGSWCTCHIGAGKAPPRDVCHVQFEARIAFKLVWCPGGSSPPAFERYVIVDDDGALLATGLPDQDSVEPLPHLREREANYAVVAGSRYAQACVTDPARGI